MSAASLNKIFSDFGLSADVLGSDIIPFQRGTGDAAEYLYMTPDMITEFVGGGAVWGNITGTLSDQTDLQAALNLKANLASPTFTGTVMLADLIATNPIDGSITGNAATVTTIPSLSGQVSNTGNAITIQNSAVITKVLTGYTSGAGVISSADTILSAIQKLNGNAGTIPALSGEVTNVGDVVTLDNGAVIGKVLTGYTSGTGTISSGDTLLTAIQKLNGNAALLAPIANPTFTGTVTASNLTVTNPITGSITGNAATVTTIPTLSGEVSNTGNAVTLANASVIAKVLTGYASGAGTISATDSLLSAIQKLNGNDGLLAPRASPTFTGTVTLPAGQAVNGVTLTTASGTGNFLSGAGTYIAPPYTPPGGSDKQVQYNNAGSLGGLSTATVNTDGTLNILPATVSFVTTSKTLALTDANTIQDCSNAASQTITIPANASVAFPINTLIVIEQNGAGVVTVTGDTGVTLNGVLIGSVNSTGQYTAFYIRKTGTNIWEGVRGINSITALTGDVTASGIGSVTATVNSIGGKAVVLGGTLTTVGAFNTAFTVSADTNVTLPASGTLLINDLSNIGTIVHDLLFTDATYDIGKSAANRPRSITISSTITAVTGAITANLTVGGTLTGSGSITAGTSSNFTFGSTRSRLSSPADGDILISNAAVNAFTSLKFGGTTSSFPEIKRNSAALNFRLADDSADCNITAAALTLSAGITTGSTTLHTTSVALTNGAGASAGTLANAPAVGNPTKWIPINDNGTTRYIPAW